MLTNILLCAYVLATSSGLIIIKLSTTSGLPVAMIDGRLSLNLNLLNVLGVGLYGISFIIYFYLISKFNIGYIIPLTTALVYILVFFASFIIFKESFSILKIVSIALIIAGVIMLNMSARG